MFTVREFVEQAYQLVSASSPTVPLQGSDLSFGIRVLNQLLQSYAATGMLLTVSKTIEVPLLPGQQNVICGDASYTPTPDITAGRLAALESAWLILENVNYPLINISRDEFYATWKYEPLQSLPRFIVVVPDIETVALRLYPAPSQVYNLFVRAKFQLSSVTSNDDMNLVPQNFHLFLMYAVGREYGFFKGRASAWTDKLEKRYQELLDEMANSTDVNVAICGDRQSMLNGAYRVRAGI